METKNNSVVTVAIEQVGMKIHTVAKEIEATIGHIIFLALIKKGDKWDIYLIIQWQNGTDEEDNLASVNAKIMESLSTEDSLLINGIFFPAPADRIVLALRGAINGISMSRFTQSTFNDILIEDALVLYSL